MSSDMQSECVRDLLSAGVLWVEDGNHGAQRPLSDEFCTDGTPFVRPDDLTHGLVDFANCDRINSKALQRIRKGRGRAGDIAFTHRATVGRIARVGTGAPDFVANPGVTLWRVLDRTKLDPNYLYYFMQTPFFMNQVWAEAGNTDTFPYISLTQQRTLEIRFPGLAMQRAFGSVLSVLDDRISVLRDSCATLEAIAQALFKSWFVDFDPVHAKDQGLSQEGIGSEVASLFPEGFSDTVIGSVPSGWAPTPVYDMATYINGAAYKAFAPNADRQGKPIIKIAELKSGVTEQTAYSAVEMPDKYLIRTGDILLSWSGNPDTSIDTFVWAFDPAWLNQHIFRVLPRSSTERAYLLELLRFLRPKFSELARNKQTTGLGHVTVADMKRLLVAVPSANILKMFDAIVQPIQAKVIESRQRIQTLVSLRDALLPRLISGQLRLLQAAALLEESTA